MDLDSLRGFVLVATEGSIAQAAPRMYLSVSALSRRLQELERELGVQLFDRTARGLVINEVGRRLLGHAEAVITAAEQLSAAAALTDASPPIRLGLCPGIEPFLRRALIAVLEESTGGPVRCVPGHNVHLIRQLGQGQLDLALIHQDPSSDRIHAELVGRERTELVFAASQPQAAKRTLSLSDFAGQPFVTSSELVSGAPVYYARLRSVLAEFGIDETVDAGSSMWIRDVVAGGTGFGIFAGTFRTADTALADQGLCIRRIQDLDLDLETYLAWVDLSPVLTSEIAADAVETARRTIHQARVSKKPSDP